MVPREYQIMSRSEIVYFAVTLFLALVALIMWKRRRDLAAARVNRGLREYAAKAIVEAPATQETQGETPGENLIPIP
jgi:hypothetical protein